MAAIAIPLAAKIIVGQLAMHTARLKDATNENEALDQVIPAFDADLAAIQQAFNGGTSADECISALETVDNNIYSYLRSLVGKPGTAWSVTETPSPCNKTCTASCCVYNNDLHPAIRDMIAACNAGGGTVTVPKVYPPSNPAYGNYERDLYTLTLQAPSVSFASQALSVSGVNVTTQPASITTSLTSSLTGSAAIAIIGLVGGIILIVTALFGQNSLRVNR